MHRFPSLGLKLRIDARKRMFPGKSLHRFASLSLKSRIDARSSPSLARSPSTSPAHPTARVPSRVDDASCLGYFAWARARQWRRKRVLMRPEAAFPYVFAAEGAQHPPIKPPRSMLPPRSSRHAQHISAAPAHQDFTLMHSAVFQLIAIGVVLLAFPYRRLGKRYPYDGSPVNAS